MKSKILLSEKIIKELYNINNGNIYIAFSGGKDSTVLLHIVRNLFPDIPAVFNNTEVEYQEIINFVKTQNNVIELCPKNEISRCN